MLVGGAMPCSYLLLVFLGQLELCPLAYQELGVQGLPAFTCPVNVEVLHSGLNPQGGEWAADGDCSCAPVSPNPTPTHPPSVCEINVVFV